MSAEHNYCVYLVASRSRVLYCGITNNLHRRVRQHQMGSVEGFSANYACNRLVWYERFQYVKSAIAREKQIKRWSRAKKIKLIERVNSSWTDLSNAWWQFPAPGAVDELDLLA